MAVHGVMPIKKIFANIIYEAIGLIRQLVRTMRNASIKVQHVFSLYGHFTTMC